MTPRCGVRTALTEERSKAEINPRLCVVATRKSPLTRITESFENITFSMLFSFKKVLADASPHTSIFTRIGAVSANDFTTESRYTLRIM